METGNASIGWDMYGLVLILFTGLRLGEAAGLMWDDIDFQKRTLKVQRTLEYVKNRNGDENSNHYTLVEGTTKSKSKREDNSAESNGIECPSGTEKGKRRLCLCILQRQGKTDQSAQSEPGA